MEEYNDFSRGPDDEGKLTLSYDDWTNLPKELCDEYTDRLLFLNLSYNKLSDISGDIGKLILLKELNVSHNQIIKLDPAIGSCIRLRRLDVSHNRIVSLPVDISHCTLLVRNWTIDMHYLKLNFNMGNLKESLVCNDNKLQCIPHELSDLPALEIFHLQNNNLLDIPSRFGLIPCLQELLCDGNQELSVTIPQHVQSDKEMILWALRLYNTFEEQKLERGETYRKMEDKYKEIVYKKCVIEENASSLTDEVEALKKSRPVRYIDIKSRTQSCVAGMSKKRQMMKRESKRVIQNIMEKVKMRFKRSDLLQRCEVNNKSSM